MDYCWDKESGNIQDPGVEFSIIDLSVGKRNLSNWDVGFVLSQWFQTMSDIPRCFRAAQGVLSWEGKDKGHTFN